MTYPPPKPPTEFALALGQRLRNIRNAKGMSLEAVEAASRGTWKAVVVGMYERGQRGISAEKLAALCSFYGVPAGEVLTGEVPVRAPEFLRGWLAPLMEMSDADLDALIRSARARGVSAA